MKAFLLTVVAETPVILNRWLTLDGILDGVLETQDVRAEERVIPLRGYGGGRMINGMTAIEAANFGAVFCASAAIVSGSTIPVTGTLDEGQSGRVATGQPKINELTIRGGFVAHRQFLDGALPYEARAQTIRTSKGLVGTALRSYRQVGPGPFQWIAQGEPERVLAILADAVGIGAKTRSGFGKIVPSKTAVQEIDNPPRLLGIVDEAGTRLMRPIPQDLFTQINLPPASEERPFPATRMRAETVRPPYWDRTGETIAIIPKTRFDSLLTR